MLISKDLYKEMLSEGYLNKKFKFPDEEVNFIELERISYKLGFLTIVSGPSFIQSLEKRHLVNKEKLLKYQNNFKKPIAWNKNML